MAYWRATHVASYPETLAFWSRVSKAPRCDPCFVCFIGSFCVIVAVRALLLRECCLALLPEEACMDKCTQLKNLHPMAGAAELIPSQMCVLEPRKRRGWGLQDA